MVSLPDGDDMPLPPLCCEDIVSPGIAPVPPLAPMLPEPLAPVEAPVPLELPMLLDEPEPLNDPGDIDPVDDWPEPVELIAPPEPAEPVEPLEPLEPAVWAIAVVASIVAAINTKVFIILSCKRFSVGVRSSSSRFPGGRWELERPGPVYQRGHRQWFPRSTRRPAE